MRIPSQTLALAALLAMVGCGSESRDPNFKAGAMQTDAVHVDEKGVESATVELKMGVGNLDISGGASELVSGKLEYNVPSWKPLVTQSKDGSSAQVRIEQPSSTKSGGNDTENRWTLQVSNKTPVSFKVECGVGEAKLNLGEMKLRDVTLQVGVGKIEMDLRGHPDQDYNVKVEGGVGTATIYLPADAAARAQVQTGLAPIKVEGLEKHGDVWESSNYGKAKTTVSLDVQGGVGAIRIVRGTGTEAN